MAEETPNDNQAAPAAAPGRGWRDLWQIPVLLGGVVLIVAGVLAARSGTAPNDYAGVLDDAETLVVRNQFDEAIDLLNSTILPRLGEPDVTPTIKQRFHLIRGDAVALGQSDRMINNRANNELIVKEYTEAEQLLAELGAEREQRMASALISLGRLEEAERRIHRLPGGHTPAKTALEKKLISGFLAQGERGQERALKRLSEMTNDPSLSPDDRVWSLGTLAELRLKTGYPDKALEGLLRAIQRIDQPDAAGVGALYLLLAQAYHELGRFPEATEQLDRADALLPDQAPRRAKLLTLAGEIAQVQGDLDQAHDRFSEAVQDYPQSTELLRAMLGVAETDSLQGDIPEAIAMYETLVQEFRRGRSGTALTADRITQSLLEQYEARISAEDYLSAIEFARLADRLYSVEDTPPSVVLALAEAHRERAAQLVEAEGVDPLRPSEIAGIDPVTRAEIRANYLDAGENYLRHARLTVLSDDLAFSDSLWMAGDSYDLAGDTDKTIEIFSEYAGGLDDDPRLPGALFRLAGAHQARGDYEIAAELYQGLLDSHPNSPEAAASYVRLAQTKILDANPENDPEARALLERILTSGRLAPDAVEYRDALVQLGRIHLREGRYSDAALALSEAIERYPDDPERTLLEFQLADAYRLAAGSVGEELARVSMPSGKRRDLETRRHRWLSEALELYDDVRARLDAIDERRRSDFQNMILRNAHFYRADCAFDLGEYEEAIRHYDAAAQRYANDPASLVAMVQIVNSYVELGRWQEARTANERARRRLQELPAEALDAPDLPMTRRHWERWLDASVALDAMAGAGPE